MCIAIVKPMGAKLPDRELLRKCWDNNPDGAGLMYNNGENVIIHKGFSKFKGFYKYLRKLDNEIDLTNKDLVLHFRIATSGGVNRECTHPFPITKNLLEMKKLDNVCEYGFAHNGIIDGYGTKDFSDTMEYVANVIAYIKNIEDEEALLDALAYEHFSRFVVLTKDNFELGGNWVKDGEYYFSNTTYKDHSYKTLGWSSLDDEYYDYSGTTRCDNCEALCYDKDIVKTGYGNLCKWCFDEVFGKELDDEPEEAKKLVF